MKSTLKLAEPNQISIIANFIMEMQKELNELPIQENSLDKNLQDAFNKNVSWFLFYDENDIPFGTCYVQEAYNYWRPEKFFYCGGFYILPKYRKQGRFKAINKQLETWVKDNNGYEIYCFVHNDNELSQHAFKSLGMKELDNYKTFYKEI